jgi:peptide methionine sulfoxide reductase MsrA
VEFDPAQITYRQILESFFEQQGGPPTWPGFSRQYRSAILVHNGQQRDEAEKILAELRREKSALKIFTDIEDATDFYRAEEYHQKYQEKAMGKWKLSGRM